MLDSSTLVQAMQANNFNKGWMMPLPIQPLRPLAFLANHIPPTISPVNHQHLNDLINNREGSPTPTEGKLLF